MRKGDGPWVAAAGCAIALAAFLVCLLRARWPLADSAVLGLTAGGFIGIILYLVSLATNDGTPGGWHRRR